MKWTAPLAGTYFSVVNKLSLVYMFVFLADDTAQPSGRDHQHHTKDFDDLPTKAQNKHGQIFALEWTRWSSLSALVSCYYTFAFIIIFEMKK